MEVMRVTRSLGEMHATPGGLVHPQLRKLMTAWLSRRRAWLLEPLALPELTPPTAAQGACEAELARLDLKHEAEAADRAAARQRAEDAQQTAEVLARREKQRRKAADDAETKVQLAGRSSTSSTRHRWRASSVARGVAATRSRLPAQPR